jgi:hypothetical protein
VGKVKLDLGKVGKVELEFARPTIRSSLKVGKVEKVESDFGKVGGKAKVEFSALDRLRKKQTGP